MKKNKILTAQDQVNNKVNAGVMDNVVGVCESDKDIYYIGSEGGNNDYFHVNENKESENKDILNYIKSINKYMDSNGLKISPYPEVELNWDEQNGLFITTGYYLPSEKKVVLYCKDRHIKDILRSYAHELIHHMQNLVGKNLSFTNNDNVKDNKELEKLESEAYLKGNIYFRKWTEYEKSKKKLNESVISNLSLSEYLTPDEVDLNSFNIKKNLNPKFWKNGKLDSRIRMKLLDIADDFIEFMDINWVKHEDITITGSLANFNWNNSYSDIDLHIIMDFSKIDERTDFVENYFHSLKDLWNKEHENLTIYGFNVEISVQDVNKQHVSSGVFSLEKNEWVIEPKRKNLINGKVNKKIIKYKVSKYTKIIDKLEEKERKYTNDEYKIRVINETAIDIFNEIKNLRRGDLKKYNNEINNGNIIFKCLRRLGYIDKLDNIIIKSYDKLNSLF